MWSLFVRVFSENGRVIPQQQTTCRKFVKFRKNVNVYHFNASHCAFLLVIICVVCRLRYWKKGTSATDDSMSVLLENSPSFRIDL